MRYFVNEISSMILKVAPEVISEGDNPLSDWIETPDDIHLGDYAFPCFRLAKVMRKSPQQIAVELAAKISLPTCFAKMEPVGGYLNFFVDRTIFAEMQLREIIQKGNAYGRCSIGEGKTIVVEYSSPNIAKPFGINHLRSTNIGDCLARILAFNGYRVVRINHLGDWGTQFGKLITAYKRWGKAEELTRDSVNYLLSLYVKFHRFAAEDPSLDDEAREWFVKLEQGEPDALELWQWFKDLSLKEFKRMYDILGIEFDLIAGESYYNDSLLTMEAELRRRNLLTTSDDAEIVILSSFDLPPALIRKQDGASLYITRDLAAAIYRQETYRFDSMIYVVGSEQKLHFCQLFAILKLLGKDWAEHCQHVEFGLIRFKDGAMSTREGNVILLQDVIDRASKIALSKIEERNPSLFGKEEVAAQVGIGAIKFFDLHAKRGKDICFDWDEILSFEGETGPYIQYTHARINSVLRKAGLQNDSAASGRTISSTVEADEEYRVIKKLGEFPETVLRCAGQREPSILARYAISLAKEFNFLYNAKRIITEDPDEQYTRLSICSAVKIVLKSTLTLLGIAAPDQM